MAELENIILPSLLLLWFLCLGLCFALKASLDEANKDSTPTNPEDAKDSTKGINSLTGVDNTNTRFTSTTQPLNPWQAEATTKEQNPYAAPQAHLESPFPEFEDLPIHERPPRLAIALSRKGDLWLVFGLITWYSMQIFLLSFLSQEQKQISREGLIGNFFIQGMLISFLCALILFRINQSAGGLRAWLGVNFSHFELKKCVLWIIPIIAATYVINGLAHYLFTSLGFDFAQQPLVNLLKEEQSFTLILVVAFFAIVVAPLSEELIFRGYFYPVLGKFCGRGASFFLCASFFALIHGNFAGLLGLGFLALCLTWIYERTASIWAPIFIHACFNGLSVVMLISF